ncbi:MAG: hypothetical protein ACK5S6_03730 [bacterium]
MEWLAYDLPEVSEADLAKLQGCEKLDELVMTAMQVDDVLLAAESSVYARFVRHMLFHIYAQADLITSVKKNDLHGTREVEFNGFVIS